MRVFLCEFVTGGGLRDKPLGASLAREGQMMRDALARDLADLPGVTVFSSCDDRLSPPAAGAARMVAEGDDPWAVWAEMAREADLVWPVAPETDELLLRLTEQFRKSGVLVVGPDAEAIRIASSKTLTARALEAPRVPTPPTWAPDGVPADPEGPFVSKPDDGAGCEATRFWPTRPSAADVPPGHVVQPYVGGQAASLTVLRRDGATTLLAANLQHVAIDDGAFAFRGLTVGGIPADAKLAALGEAVGRALPGLDGLFGVDIVLGPEGPIVIEINPRATTAYAGLRDAIGMNPASLVAPFSPEGAPSAARPVEIAV